MRAVAPGELRNCPASVPAAVLTLCNPQELEPDDCALYTAEPGDRSPDALVQVTGAHRNGH